MNDIFGKNTNKNNKTATDIRITKTITTEITRATKTTTPTRTTAIPATVTPQKQH